MDRHALKVLEYNELLSHVARFAQSQPGAELVMGQLPHRETEEVRRCLQLTGEAIRLLELAEPDLSSVCDTSPVLKRLNIRDAVLSPDDLLSLLRNQRSVRRAKGTLREAGGTFTGLSAIVQGMNSYKEWADRVRDSLSEAGDILDTASAGLARSRSELRSCRDTVVRKLEGFSGKASVRKVLQDGYVTQRNGRYVVPAKSEYHRAFEGVVQDTSQSGQTLFVEPLFAVELNNRFAKAKIREEEEVRKALAAMSEAARDIRDGLAANLELLSQLDLVLAKARFGEKLGGVIPAIDGDTMDLRNARHPLLELRSECECVPVSLGLGGSYRVLVITGPNTGGKTVALKTLGLLTLMVQSGIPVPVDGSSRTRVFSRIFADIGDEQSLSQNLSTFSAHISIISEILEQADGDTLVLLDELGAGTDPQEGSALGVALLEVLHGEGAWAVVTTHHNLLKEFAYRAPYARNASAVFDPDTLKPTYEIRMDMPGRSHALEIAGRLGLSDQVIERARKIMGTGAVRVDELLGRLSEELDRETRARSRAEEVVDQLEIEKERLRIRQERAREENGRIRDEARREAKSLIRDLDRRGRELLKEIKNHPDAVSSRLRDEIALMEKEVSRRVPAPPLRKGRGGPVRDGQDVEIAPLGIMGTVLSLAGKGTAAEVQAGGIRMRLPVDHLTPLSGKRGDANPETERQKSVLYLGDSDAPAEINLLGFTVDEALRSVDRVLDRSILGPHRSLRIVHGKGTGALRRAILETLDGDPRIQACRQAPQEEGGAGVTIVELKE